MLVLLVFRLVDIIKNNPIIVSKAGAAHVVTSLTSQCLLDLQAFTGKLLSTFLSGLSDRNPAVRMNYAGCIGHLVRTWFRLYGEALRQAEDLVHGEGGRG